MASGTLNTSKSVQEQMAQFILSMGGSQPTSDGMGELWAAINAAFTGFSPPSGSDIALGLATGTAQSIPRWATTVTNVPLGTGSTGTTNTLVLQALYVPVNTVVNNFNIMIGTASSGVSNQSMYLLNSSRVILAATMSNTTTDLTANTLYTQAVATVAGGSATSFTTTYSGLYYVGFLCCAGTAVPTAWGITAGGTALNNAAPKLVGLSTTGQSTALAVGGSAQTAISTAQAGNFYVALT